MKYIINMYAVKWNYSFKYIFFWITELSWTLLILNNGELRKTSYMNAEMQNLV